MRVWAKGYANPTEPAPGRPSLADRPSVVLKVSCGQLISHWGRRRETDWVQGWWTRRISTGGGWAQGVNGHKRGGGLVAVCSPPSPTCQSPLCAAHTLCQGQRQRLQPGGRFCGGHLGEVEVQGGCGASGEGQRGSVLLQTDGHRVLLTGCPGERGNTERWEARRLQAVLPLVREQAHSPEQRGDGLAATQAEAGFLWVTEAVTDGPRHPQANLPPPGASPLPTCSLRRSGVKRVLQSSTPSVTLGQARDSIRRDRGTPTPRRPRHSLEVEVATVPFHVLLPQAVAHEARGPGAWGECAERR